jgi:LemA protein
MKNVLIVVAIIALLLGLTYNSMVKPRNNVDLAWDNVQTQYQRRADVINNLIGSVKSQANFEQKTLTDIIEARSKATSINLKADDLTPENMAKFEAAQAGLNGSLSRLMLVVENYPNLRTSDAYLAFMKEIEGSENRVAKAREDFNASIKDYNNAVTTFPKNLVASLFGFAKKDGFNASAAAQDAPDVDKKLNGN